MTASKTLGMHFILATMLLLGMAAATVVVAEETRQSVSSQFTKAERDRGGPGRVSEDEFAPLRTEGVRHTSKPSLATSPGRATAASNDFWFYTADVVLFNDHDNDGHFHGIDLLFDADTIYIEADVYAVVYLSLADGPWNEYSVTDNFTLYGQAAEDEYVIVTELVSGYPTGSYDLLIELFDAYDDSFLASFGPADTSELAFLPLEDSARDEPFDDSTTVIVRERGGGSTGWLLLLVLLCAQRIAARRSPGS